MAVIYLSLVSLSLASWYEETYVENANISLGASLTSSEFTIFLDQDAAATDFTGVWFDLSGTQVTATSWLLDEGVDFYLTQPGDILTNANIAADLFPTILEASSLPNTSAETNTVDVGGSQFYLGFATDIASVERDVFGWVHLDISSGIPEILESGILYCGHDGIVVGGAPEPSGALLIGIATGLLMFKRRRE